MTNKITEIETDNNLEQTELLETVSTAGMLLRTAREKKGVSIDAVAIQLHLRPSVIEDIENDIFDNIASATYARGYAKNFAKYVEADVNAVQQCLAQQLPDETAAMQSFSRKTTREARDSRLTLVTYLIVAILLALLLLWWVQKDSMLTGVDLSKPTAEEVAAANVAQQTQDLLEPEIDPKLAYREPVASESISAQSQNDDPVQVSSNVQDNNGVIEPATATDTLGSVAVTPAVTAAVDTVVTTADVIVTDTISLSFSDDCWVNIIDADGKTLVDGVKGSARVVEVTGKAPFKVILGAPQVVTMSFNNENVSLAEFSDRVAKLTLPKG
ncbi:RodZ domain-containing protein [Shewanella sp. UCD-KL21]|uniref:RodZ domain-containing protein n=1 Tax=Shewanella sp. UCD-KL21 TaxID=1917164 RepID=UPI0009707902|nr:RodZ domain-containing protein [Shewanella sp. UCD-KL21]